MSLSPGNTFPNAYLLLLMTMKIFWAVQGFSPFIILYYGYCCLNYSVDIHFYLRSSLGNLNPCTQFIYNTIVSWVHEVLYSYEQDAPSLENLHLDNYVSHLGKFPLNPISNRESPPYSSRLCKLLFYSIGFDTCFTVHAQL